MELLKKAAALAATIRAISSDVLTRNIGRQDVVKATFLSLISGRPAFFLGAPGVNKTGTVQSLARRVTGAVFHEELMPAVVSADQLLVESTSIEETPAPGGGKNIRVKNALGRAAAAHIFFADEIWKGDERVLQTVIDLAKGDGVRHDGDMVKTPLMAFLAASNELPEPDGKLGAMWSRMTIRVQVNPLDRLGKKSLVAARLARQKTPVASGGTLSLQDIETLRAARPHVALNGIEDTVLDIYEQLGQDHPGDFDWLWADDRRFGRVMDVLQAHALLDGRTTVSTADLAVLEWLLWDTPEQIAQVKAIVDPLCRTPIDECRELVDALLSTGGLVDLACQGQTNHAVNALTQVNACKAQLTAKLAALPGSDKTKVDGWIKALTTLGTTIAMAAAGAFDRDAATTAYGAVKSALS